MNRRMAFLLMLALLSPACPASAGKQVGTLRSYAITARLSLVTYDSATSTNAVASSQPDPTGALPGSSTYGYGLLKEWSFPLPAGTNDEIIFDLFTRCSEPFTPGDGLLLDDLRVE